ncbi:hypothetical protein Pan241w_13110 [Gimesia alba]|uniref:Uncharacterized protein n=1 Tax=Gimesia alba TaxID=2527973 RepID=A0A517RBI2_9PLAN|nr:hypothetical protein Pan241w_13110 [Gimesia alba]
MSDHILYQTGFQDAMIQGAGLQESGSVAHQSGGNHDI